MIVKIIFISVCILLSVSNAGASSPPAQDNYATYGLEQIQYHTPAAAVPTDRCGSQDKHFPYALEKIASDSHVSATIAHAVLAIWVFIFFIPVSVFPVLYHRIAPPSKKNRVDKWIRTHFWLSLPVFPLLTVSMVCALNTDLHDREVMGHSPCSFYDITHELIGAGCYLIYFFQFGCSFFCYKGLHNERYKNLRFYHGLSNCFGYLISIAILAMVRVTNKSAGANRYLYTLPYYFFLCFLIVIHIRMKYADFLALKMHLELEARIVNDNRGVFFRTAQWEWDFGLPIYHRDLHVDDSNLYQSENSIHLARYESTYKFYWVLFIIVAFVTAVIMSVHIILTQPGMYPASTRFLPEWTTAGDFGVDWGDLNDFAL